MSLVIYSSTFCVWCRRLHYEQLENVMGDNSTENRTVSNTTKTVPTALFDPAWQLALTVEFYFQYAVIAIGIFGAAANALVLYALIAYNAREAKKRAINLLIINQNLLDFSCCLLVVISLGIKMSDIYHAGTLGYLVCTFFGSNQTATTSAVYGSIINLVALTIERYLKVVHPFWSKRYLRRRVVYAAMAFAWIAGVAIATPVSFVSSRVEGGFCITYLESPNWIYESCALVFFFVFPLVIFIYCYGRMVVVMRRQMSVMAGHSAEGSAQMNASQAQSKRVKWNIIKTMIVYNML